MLNVFIEYYCTMSFIRVYGVPEPVSHLENGNGQNLTPAESKLVAAQK